MARQVQCVILKREAEGLDAPPHPGELGLRVYTSVSREAWKMWLEHLVMVMNDNGLNTADPGTVAVIEEHMRGYFFGEGKFSGANAFKPPKKKK